MDAGTEGAQMLPLELVDRLLPFSSSLFCFGFVFCFVCNLSVRAGQVYWV